MNCVVDVAMTSTIFVGQFVPDDRDLFFQMLEVK
jgi:hypothetical protein